MAGLRLRCGSYVLDWGRWADGKFEFLAPYPSEWSCQIDAKTPEMFHLESKISAELYPARSIATSGRLTHYSANFRSRKAFVITEIELMLIAALAIIGLSSTPQIGNSTPAASGIPSAL